MEIWRTSESNENYREYGKGFVVVDLSHDKPEVERVKIDLPREFYQEVIDYCLGYKKKSDLQYYTQGECFDAKVTLEGDDWTVSQHRIVNPKPTEEDFRQAVYEYMLWDMTNALHGGV
jgi:hypothetical protein